jgi:hypothetical protein
MKWKISSPGAAILLARGDPRRLFEPTQSVQEIVGEVERLGACGAESVDYIRARYAETARATSSSGGGGGCCGAGRDYTTLSKQVSALRGCGDGATRELHRGRWATLTRTLRRRATATWVWDVAPRCHWPN